MIYKIAQKELLLQQAHALRRKNYRPGFDGMTAHHAIIWLEINGDQLYRRLLRGSYDPMMYLYPALAAYGKSPVNT